MNTQDITLCLIVKDEESYVSKCIESVQPYMSEVLIADTGSSDNTVSICKKYTDRVFEISFEGGFSKARNFLLEKVRTPWVLFLDADEYFDKSEIEKVVDEASHASNEVDAFELLRYNFFNTGGFYTSNTIKLFRSKPDLFYTGIVVDSIKPSIKKSGGTVAQSSAILNHFGHCRSVEIRNQKAYKYLAMMDDELKDNPDNFRVAGYKSLVLRSLGNFSEAEIWWKKAVSLAPNEGHPHFVGGHLARALGRPKEAIEHYTTALKQDRCNSTYLNSRGVANLSIGMYSDAMSDFREALQNTPSHCHLTLNIGLVHEATENYNEAVECYEAISNKHPAFLKSNFTGSVEFDPYSGLIYDTIYNFKGLHYHLSFCREKLREE